jgi:hypothetical protein
MQIKCRLAVAPQQVLLGQNVDDLMRQKCPAPDGRHRELVRSPLPLLVFLQAAVFPPPGVEDSATAVLGVHHFVEVDEVDGDE